MEGEEQDNPDLLSTKDLLQTGVDAAVVEQFETIITWGKIIAITSLSLLGINIISFIYRWQERYAYRTNNSLVAQSISWIVVLLLNVCLLQFCNQLRKSLYNENQEQFTMAASRLKIYMMLLFIWLMVSILMNVAATAIILLHL